MIDNTWNWETQFESRVGAVTTQALEMVAPIRPQELFGTAGSTIAALGENRGKAPSPNSIDKLPTGQGPGLRAHPVTLRNVEKSERRGTRLQDSRNRAEPQRSLHPQGRL
jgi:hypothetical protein